jgi:CheY-like chemotaxis protein
MGGSITVSSVVNEGSIFTLTLPLKVGFVHLPQTKLPNDANDNASSRPRGHILLVEDYQPNVLVASTLLEMSGYTCEIAGDGEEAVEKFAGGSYHAILMDVQMPNMNGFQATQAIRHLESQKSLPRVPVIGMTAHALDGDRERCLAAGMDDYISKPFAPADLQKKLAQLVAI